jgi:hypothetical protein
VNHDDDTPNARRTQRPTADDQTLNVVVVQTGERFEHLADRLEWLFMCWLAEAGYDRWEDGVWALARCLRGAEATGLIERRTVREVGRPTLHGFVLTEDGEKLLRLLAGTEPGEGP